MATPTYELIETTTLTSPASSVSFTSITQDYRDLVLAVDAISDGVHYTRLGINAGTISPTVSMGGNGTTTYSRSLGGGGNEALFGGFDLYASGAGLPVQTVIHIMDYSATDKFKPLVVRTNILGGTNPGAFAWAGRNSETTAVTSLTVFGTSGIDHTKPNRFSLYGIAS